MQLLSQAEVMAVAHAAAHYTRADIQEALEAQRWTFARTMPTIPHSYCLKRDWDHAIPWGDVIHAMAAYARPMRWRRSIRLYFDAGDFRHWWMDESLAQVDLINRQRLELSTCKPLDTQPQQLSLIA